MDQPTLHPNLARLATSYDRILTRYQNGEIDRVTAEQELSELITRDDQGVQWMLSSATGRWMRKELRGTWVEDAPPVYGLRTASPHDFSAQPAFNPDSRVQFAVVDESTHLPSNSLTGATRRALAGGPHRAPGQARRTPGMVAAVAALILIALGSAKLYSVLTDEPTPNPAPAAPGVPAVPAAPAP